jgi:uncharacterized metal-binding protein YceD (DUF177 family)
VKKENEYIIQFSGLKEGTHEYSYSVDDHFFSIIENSMYENGNIKVILSLNKTMNMLIFNFNISGTVSSICDKCLETLDVPLSCDEKIYIKFGEEYDEPAEDIIILPFGEHEIDISKIIYDVIVTSLPIRHIHSNDKKCNPEMIKKLKEYSVHEHSGYEHEDETDPRWNELKKIIDKK